MTHLTKPLCLVMILALTVGHGAYTEAGSPTVGQEKLRAVAPRALVKPTSGTPQSATPRAVCTFASIGLYWTPDGGAEDKPCRVRYRAAGEPTWREALPLWFDKRIGEYRGSIVQLQSGTTYEVRLELAGGGPSTELTAATWSETFPIARTVPVDDMTGTTLIVDQSGTAAGYVLYTHRAGAATATIDAADKADQCVEVKASYVILRGLTLRSPRIHGIVLGKGAHDVVIEGCDISGWGRVDKDGWGVDYDSAIYSKYEPLTRVIVQRNRMHIRGRTQTVGRNSARAASDTIPRARRASASSRVRATTSSATTTLRPTTATTATTSSAAGRTAACAAFRAPTPTSTATVSRAAGTTGWSWRGAAAMSASGAITSTARWSRSPSPGCRSGRSTSSATSPAAAASVTQAGAASRS